MGREVADTRRPCRVDFGNARDMGKLKRILGRFAFVVLLLFVHPGEAQKRTHRINLGNSSNTGEEFLLSNDNDIVTNGKHGTAPSREIDQSVRRLATTALEYKKKVKKAGTYDVRLHFANPSCKTKKSVKYDIIIEGDLKLKKFDVCKAAGGKALTKEFVVKTDKKKVSIVFSPAKKRTKVGPAIDDIEVEESGDPSPGEPPAPGPSPSPGGGSWEKGASMKTAVGEVACGIIGSKMFVIGEGSPATQVYDLKNNKWLPNAAPRKYVGNHHAVEVCDGKLIVIGGFKENSEGTVQIYDSKTNSWKEGAKMPWAAGSVSSAKIGGIIYVCGGIVSKKTVDTCAKYNPKTDTWDKNMPTMIHGRNHAAAATDGHKFYICGGRGKGSGDSNKVANGFNHCQVYDPKTDKWNSFKALPFGRGGMGHAVWVSGKMYVMGGETENGPGATKNGVYDRCAIYSPKENSWDSCKKMPTAKHGIFPVAYKGKIYVAGGGTKSGKSQSKTLEIFTS